MRADKECHKSGYLPHTAKYGIIPTKKDAQLTVVEPNLVVLYKRESLPSTQKAGNFRLLYAFSARLECPCFIGIPLMSSRTRYWLDLTHMGAFNLPQPVNSLKGKRINWPMAVNDSYILTVGDARPRDGAVQSAPTEMIPRLGELGLEGNAAHILLGQCVEHYRGNVFYTAHTMFVRSKRAI